MIFIEEDGQYIIVQCEKCGEKHRKHRIHYKQYGNEYHFNQPITCKCGNIDNIAYKELDYDYIDTTKNELIKCPRCGSKIPENSKFCLECGEKIEVFENDEIKEDKSNIQYDLNNNIKITKQDEYHRKILEEGLRQRKLNQEKSEKEKRYEELKQIKCPRCGSTQIQAFNKGFGLGKAVTGGVLLGGVGLLGGFIGSKKVMVTCLNCGHKWEAGK